MSKTTAVGSNEFFSGVRWTGIGQVVTEAVRMLVSVVLARLLVPEDFGLLSMASVITGLVMIFQYLGASAVVIQRKELSDSLVTSLFYLNVLASLLLSGILYFAAPWLAGLYNEPALVLVIEALSLSFIVTAIGTIPGALLNRDLRFDRLAQVSFIAAAIQGVVAVIMAYAGYGVWALVVSNILSSLASSVFMWWASHWWPKGGFSWKELRDVLGFCLNMTGLNLVDYSSRDADKFIIGRWLGEANLGYYTMAYRFCLYPPLVISPILNRVLFAAFSRLQDDEEQLTTIYLRAVGGIAFITFPLIAGMMVIADPFVMAILGQKWAPAIAIMIALGPVGALQAICTPANYVLLAKGKANWLFWLTIVSTGLTVLSLIAAISLGVVWVALAYSIVTLPLTALRFDLSLRLLNAPFTKLLSALAPYFFASILMSGIVWVCRFGLDQLHVNPAFEMMTVIPIGVISYILLMYLWQPPAVRDFSKAVPSKLKPLIERFLK